MRLVDKHGACDCHSHVFGPYDKFPLSPQRTFDTPQSSIDQLESVWRQLGIERAVLIQGSAHGNDHRALLAAISRSPKTRRGVALLSADVSDSVLTELSRDGICAVRFNWIHHLLAKDPRTAKQRLTEAECMLRRIRGLGWHVELHIDVTDLDLAARLSVPSGMPVVIDHMARIDVSGSSLSAQIAKLLKLIDRHEFWVKLSGADRLTVNSEQLGAGLNTIRQVLKSVPERCVWGLDWPHVNLSRKRTDLDLVDFLLEVAGDEKTLERIMVLNPQELYGFDPAVH
jgi:predicted TIM-barrel fold metal-dependent hydrolase